MSGADAGGRAHVARAMELANAGIGALAAGDHEAAVQAWREALAYAERHLPGENIVGWIRSGLGDALLQAGDNEGALEMAAAALDYCASVRAPLAALTMAKAHLRLGDVARARDYARQACALRGESVMKAFRAAEREALGPIASG